MYVYLIVIYQQKGLKVTFILEHLSYLWQDILEKISNLRLGHCLCVKISYVFVCLENIYKKLDKLNISIKEEMTVFVSHLLKNSSI